MNFVNKQTGKTLLLILFGLAAISVPAQDAKLNLDKLKGLENKARDVIEVNIDGKVLELAKRVLVKINDKNAKTIGEAIKGLKGIYVRVFNFEKDDEYNLTDIDDIRNQLKSPDWERIANVRSKRKNQKIDVFTKFSGDTMSGVAVVMSETKTLAVINVIGPIDIDTLVEISGKLNIPKIDIEKNSDKKEKPDN